MSQEITLTGGISVYKSSIMSTAIAKSFTNWLFNMSGNYYSEQTVLIGTSATAIPLGQVTSPHWCYMRNMDPTNYIQLMNGAAGAVFARLLGGAYGTPVGGEFLLGPLDAACVPYGIANTAACLLEYVIFSL